MRSINLLVVMALMTLLVGCVTRPTMSREEYLSTTQRTYENKSQNDVLNAAEKLFILSDADDYKFHHTDNSLNASRHWLVYLVIAASMGTDNWIIQTNEVKGGTKASAMVSTSAGAIGATYINNNPGTITTPSTGTLATGPAVYELFWARMDYLLGKSDKWMTCDDLQKMKEKKLTWGDDSALCNSFNVKDELPVELRKPTDQS